MWDTLVTPLLGQAFYDLFVCVWSARRWVQGTLFTLLQKIASRDPLQHLTGTHTSSNCVVKFKILLRWKSRPTKASSLQDFMLWRYPGLTSKYAVFKKNVSLYCVTPDLAVFVRTPLDTDCYSSKTSPFFYLAQFQKAQDVYVMSVGWFCNASLEMAELCNAKVPVTWLSSTGRCGSTMLTQVMEMVPGAVCISEPDAVLNILMLAKSQRTQTYFEGEGCLLASVIRVLICSVSGITEPVPSHIFIKTRSECAGLMPHILKLRPDIRHVFMYRRLPSLFRSMRQLLSSLCMPCMTLVNSDVIAYFTPYFRRRLFHQEFYGKEEESILLEDLVPRLSYIGILATTILCHLRMVRSLQKKHSVPVLLYEDVLENPSSIIGSLLDHLSIPRGPLHNALTSMSQRSQGSVPALDCRQQSCRSGLTKREVEQVSLVLHRLWLPKMDEDIQYGQRIGHTTETKAPWFREPADQ